MSDLIIVRDAQGNPIGAYSPTDLQAFALNPQPTRSEEITVATLQTYQQAVSSTPVETLSGQQVVSFPQPNFTTITGEQIYVPPPVFPEKALLSPLDYSDAQSPSIPDPSAPDTPIAAPETTKYLYLQLRYFPTPLFNEAQLRNIFSISGKIVEIANNALNNFGVTHNALQYEGTVIDTATRTITIQWIDRSFIPIAALGAIISGVIILLALAGVIYLGHKFLSVEQEKQKTLQTGSTNTANAIDDIRALAEQGYLSPEQAQKMISNILENQDQINKQVGGNLFGDISNLVSTITPLIVLFLIANVATSFKK